MSLAWLDSVPGARAAHQWLTANVSRFNAAGGRLRAQLAVLDDWWAHIPPPPHSPEQLAVLNEWVAVRNGILATIGRWDAANVFAAPVWAAVEDVNADRVPTALPSPPPPSGLGIVPLATAALVAGWVLALYITLRQFFAYLDSHESTIEQFTREAVATGAMSPEQAARVLREGDTTDIVDQITTLVTLGIAAAVVIMVTGSQRRAAA